jgi:hypothetical protein
MIETLITSKFPTNDVFILPSMFLSLYHKTFQNLLFGNFDPVTSV